MFSIREVSDSKRIVELDESEVTFGRGPFLAVRDKRVSRNHGTLKQLKHGIEIKSVHVNPCFYAKKSQPEKWLKLDKSETVVLEVGDLFSLLPKQYIYEVIKNHENTTNGTVRLSSENGDKNGRVGGDSMKTEISIESNTNHLTTTTVNDRKSPVPETKNTFESNNDDLTTERSSVNEPKPELTSKVEKFDSTTGSHSRSQNLKSEESPVDGGKEVALPSDKKRKLPAWMSNSKKIIKTDGKSTKTTPKIKSQNVNNTPKSSTAKRRQKMPSVKFDSSEDERTTGNSAEDPKNDGQSTSTEITTPKNTQPTPEDLNNPEQKYGNIEMVDVSVSAQISTVQNDNNLNITNPVPDSPTCANSKIDRTSLVTIPNKTFTDDDSMDQVNISHPSGDTSPTTIGAIGSGHVKVPAHIPTTSSSSTNPLRSSCAFGSSCYRKNPQHFLELSHPGDADYVDPDGSDSDDSNIRPECPYGTSCYRKNPLHKKQYKHSKRVAPKRAAKIRAARRAQRNDESSSDDYDFDDSFIDDDISDEDSDWNPSQNSQTTKTTNYRRKGGQPKYADSDSSTDDDDLSDLVLDAKKFAGNKKMWKK